MWKQVCNCATYVLVTTCVVHLCLHTCCTLVHYTHVAHTATETGVVHQWHIRKKGTSAHNCNTYLYSNQVMFLLSPGFRPIEAPVTGGLAALRTGSMATYVGGNEDVINEVICMLYLL